MEGWQEFGELHQMGLSRYKFDLVAKCRCPDDGEDQVPANVITKPLEVRGTVIGSLGINEDPDQPLTKEEQASDRIGQLRGG